VTKSTPDVQEQIRLRAYELYEQREKDGGHELDDWLQAEKEVTQQEAKTVAAWIILV
jgi:outer membrane protein TolC